MPASTIQADDPTRRLLAEIDDPNRYIVVDGVPIFDEHAEYRFPSEYRTADGKTILVRHGQTPPKGARIVKYGRQVDVLPGQTPPKGADLVARYGLKELQEIARNSNRRETLSGDLSPITIGHTVDDVSEEQQPEIVGYGRNHRVGKWRGRNCILARCHFMKDRADEARKYPRRSIELWAANKVIDCIALLRRTPQRDLGLLTFSKPPRAGLVRYQMRDDPPETEEATMPADMTDDLELDVGTDTDSGDDDLAPDEAAMAERFWKHYAKNNPVVRYMCDQHKKYEAEMGGDPSMPAGGNTFVPGEEDTLNGGAGGDVTRMQKDSQAIKFSRMEREMAEMKAKLQAAEEAKAKAIAERRCAQLQAEGYEIDRPTEVKRMSKMTAQEQDAHCNHIRRFHKRSPAGQGFIPVADHTPGFDDIDVPESNGDRPRRFSREDRERAVQLAQEKGIPYEQAVKEIQGR